MNAMRDYTKQNSWQIARHTFVDIHDYSYYLFFPYFLWHTMKTKFGTIVVIMVFKTRSARSHIYGQTHTRINEQTRIHTCARTYTHADTTAVGGICIVLTISNRPRVIIM